jgi:hypothetical protein
MMKGWHKTAPKALLTAHYPHLSSCVSHRHCSPDFVLVHYYHLVTVANGLASKWKTDDHSQIWESFCP